MEMTAGGETGSNEDLAALHAASVGWALLCCAWDRQEAEEVVQASYLKAFSGRARFDGRSSRRTWLFGVIRRTAAERRRGAWLRRLALARWWNGQPRPAPLPGPDVLASASETTRALRRALNALPRRQREMLHLVFYEELTVEAAAEVLGISVGTARTHYHRGKGALRERLQAKGKA